MVQVFQASLNICEYVGSALCVGLLYKTKNLAKGKTLDYLRQRQRRMKKSFVTLTPGPCREEAEGGERTLGPLPRSVVQVAAHLHR
jgi:hypothetical protein